MSGSLLSVSDLAVHFRHRPRPFAPVAVNRAVDGVSFTLEPQHTFAVVGESGSGKSTLTRAVMGMVRAKCGRVWLDDVELTNAPSRRLRQVRRRMQLVFQDPYSSLDPSMTVGHSLQEPLRIHERLSGAARRDTVVEALHAVGLSAGHAERYPQEFSGGQRQRICIARAMILRPDLVILDEPVSALDVSTQGQVLNLLAERQAKQGTAYMLIAHDLSVVHNIADHTGVMYLGHLVETGPTERVADRPAHPYTAALMSAVPEPHPGRERTRERIVLHGDIPSPWHPPQGCVFHTRCPYVMDICRTVNPPLIEIEGGGVAQCHLHTEGPKLGGQSVRALEPAATRATETVPDRDRRAPWT